MNVIVLDTETTNTIDDPICYDIGWAVIDLDTRETVLTRSFAVAEIFCDEPLMACAYFAEKIPTYWREIRNGKRTLARLFTICKALRADCKEYGVKEIYAHNARFDYRSCNLTQRFVTASKYRYFFPYGVKMCDTLKMARECFADDPDYNEFCEVNGYKTPNGQNRYTAEILYRYLSRNNAFEEVHQGIDDVLIEKDIMLMCMAYGVTNGALFA